MALRERLRPCDRRRRLGLGRADATLAPPRAATRAASRTGSRRRAPAHARRVEVRRRRARAATRPDLRANRARAGFRGPCGRWRARRSVTLNGLLFAGGAVATAGARARASRSPCARSGGTRRLLKLRRALDDHDGQAGHQHDGGGLERQLHRPRHEEPARQARVPRARACGHHAVDEAGRRVRGLDRLQERDRPLEARPTRADTPRTSPDARAAEACSAGLSASSARAEKRSRASWQVMAGSAPAWP